MLRSRAGELSLDEEDVAPVKTLLEQDSLAVADLGPELARRLLLAGLAVVPG